MTTPSRKDGEPVLEVEAAYGLLWRLRDPDRAVIDCRKSLLTIIGKDGQRRGLEWAQKTFGPRTRAEEEQDGWR